MRVVFRAAQALLSEQGGFTFSLTQAFRLLIIMRCFSALYRILDDCDEVYNYWEPTHYLLQGYGRETWEYSTDYKIRSWAFIFVNAVVGVFTKLVSSTKVKKKNNNKLGDCQLLTKQTTLDANFLPYSFIFCCHFFLC